MSDALPHTGSSSPARDLSIGTPWHVAQVRTHRPTGQVRGATLVAPAVGVRAHSYDRVAAALASAGQLVAVVDYPGLGAAARYSRTTDLLTWAQSTDAALGWLRREASTAEPAVPINFLGHSFGGQTVGLIDLRDVDQVILVGAGSAYWRHHPAAMRRWIRLFWHVLVPLSVAAAGYFPGSRLGFGADLPRGVVLQWRRWALCQEYWAADVPDIGRRHGAITAPVTAIQVADDEVMSPRGLEALTSQLVGTSCQTVTVQPADVDQRRLGHMALIGRAGPQIVRDQLLPVLSVLA